MSIMVKAKIKNCTIEEQVNRFGRVKNIGEYYGRSAELNNKVVVGKLCDDGWLEVGDPETRIGFRSDEFDVIEEIQ